MAIVSRDLGYLFIHSPRTGGTALTRVLVSRLKGRPVPKKRVEIQTGSGKPRLVRQHITKPNLVKVGLLSPEEASTLFTFTAIRNPFDSLVSAYIKKRDSVPGKTWAGNHPRTAERVAAAAGLPFADYIVDQYAGRPPRHLYSAQIEGADLVMRFEQLQADFEKVLDHLGIEERIEIPVSNTTNRDRDYRSYYTDEARQIVTEVFKPDLDEFGYAF